MASPPRSLDGAPGRGFDEAELARAFSLHGYCVLDRVVEPATLELLRVEADRAVEEEAALLRRGGPRFVPVSTLDDRYAVTGRARSSAALRSFAISELMAKICRAALGNDAWLFSETFVCKEPNNRHGWIWHQDAAYLAHAGFSLPPNLSLWVAIDRMTEQNGTLQVLPWSLTGLRHLVPHDFTKPWDSDEMVSFGDFPPLILPVDAGSIVVMSGLLPHASSPNQTGERRRAYLLQFSPRPVERDGRPFQLAIPLLANGVAQLEEK